MAYISEAQYNNVCNIRDMINGELNRIAVTDDIEEHEKNAAFLRNNIESYIKHHRDRINGVYEPDIIESADIKL